MKLRWILALMLGLTLVIVQQSVSADKEEFKASCPLSGAPAKAESSVNYKGGKVFFCCDNCPKKFTASPEKFAAKAHHQMLSTGQAVQVACPISGRKLNKEQTVDIGGVKVAFCCGNCKKKAEESDEAVALLADFDKCCTAQTKCPVSDKPINPESSVEHDGKKVYFCCKGCPGAFTANPEKFISKLPQFAEPEKE
jgi:YHS domain-containing protein